MIQVLFRSDLSEDDQGNLLYVREKDASYRKLRDEVDKREKYLEGKGRQLSQDERNDFKRRCQVLEKTFYADLEAAQDQIEYDEVDDDPELMTLIKKFGRQVFIENMLNKRVRDIGLSKDVKTEIVLISMRQRRRFLQCKRLDLPVPTLYKRVHSVKTLPRFLQDELLKYSDVIARDPLYVQDDELVD